MGLNPDEITELAEQLPCDGKDSCPHCKLMNRLKERKQEYTDMVSRMEAIDNVMQSSPQERPKEFEEFRQEAT